MTGPDHAPKPLLERLETLTGELIRTVAELREENAHLRAEVRALRAEREDLSRTNRQAAARVDMLIARLKAMEQEP